MNALHRLQRRGGSGEQTHRARQFKRKGERTVGFGLAGGAKGGAEILHSPGQPREPIRNRGEIPLGQCQ